MYEIHYYQDARGRRPVAEYIDELSRKKDKDSQIKYKKIKEYIELLSMHGLELNERYIKRLEGNIWELRPIRDRILFVAWQEDGSFVLLHHFMKTTQKTPPREIDQAKREYNDILERGVTDD